MGLAIGSHGTNIQAARNIKGVEDIQVIENADGHTPVLFKVIWFSFILRILLHCFYFNFLIYNT